MTEKEKMLSGEWYNPADKELWTERQNAKNICYIYNHTEPNKLTYKRRIELLEQLFNQKVNHYMNVEPNIFVDYGIYTKVGKDFYANYNLTLLDAGGITFGDNVLIGPNCSFYTSIHPVDKDERNKGIEAAKKITVGNDVWICGGVTVLPGVTIGNNVIIGAGSVVTKDIPDDVVVAGNPAKIIKKNKNA